jgi:DNA-binding NarL/FixJ family response regulator
MKKTNTYRSYQEKSMSATPVRVLLVDSDPSSEGHLRAKMAVMKGFEVVGIAHSQRMAMNLIKTTQPDVILVDLMSPGYGSVDFIATMNESHPEIRILAVSPGDIPHDKILLAIQAGALGFITRDTSNDEVGAAIQRVYQGEHWLPLDDTYAVLAEAANELAVTSQERRNRLGNIVLGLIPLTGIIAAITALLWRDYWGQIDVRVVDLGIDPTTRLTDVLGVFLLAVGIFGPLLFVKSWVESIGNWSQKRLPAIADWITKARRYRLGRLIFNQSIAIGLFSLLLVLSLVWLTQVFRLFVAVIIGPAVGLILLANLLDMDQELPDALRLPHLGARRVIIFLGVIVTIFLLVISTEVWTKEPDLRSDGLHGFLAPEALGFSAKPMMLYDLDGNFEPLGALYLGGNADLYVLYDPCQEIVRLIPVGSSRVEMVDRVVCP